MGGNGGVRGVTNAPTDSLASGRWSVGEVFRAVKGDSWPFNFTPDALSPALWLDASDTSTITESGGAVSQWDNKGSLGNFTQATGALQPTTGATTLNGLNVVSFDEAYLTSADTASAYKFLHDGTKYIVAAAWKPGNTANPQGIYPLAGNNSSSSGQVGFSLNYDDNPVSSRNNVLQHGVFFGSSGNFNVLNNSANNSIAANTFSVTTLLADPDNATAANRSEMFVNTGSAVKNNSATNSVSSSDPSFALDIGASGDGDFRLEGAIAEIVIVSGANATEENRIALRDYLNDKWAVY